MPTTQLDRIEAKLDQLLWFARVGLIEGEQTMLDLEALKAQVQANVDAESSAVQLIQGIAAQLKDLAGDPAAVANLAAKLKASADALAADVVANTSAAPPAP